jgi:hypothetical protein
MSDRNDRSNRLARRLGDEPDEPDETESDESPDTVDAEPTTEDDGDSGEDEQSSPSTTSSSKPSKTEKTDMPAETDAPETESVKDRPSVLMYLPEDLHQEMDIRFDELNAAAKREFGEGLEKNRHWYPLLLSLALDKADEMSTEELLARLDDTEN